MSPTGRVDLSKGWIGRVQSNWKLWPKVTVMDTTWGLFTRISTDTYYDDVAVGETQLRAHERLTMEKDTLS